MSEPGQESGTVTESVDWAKALSETLSKSGAEKPETKAASEPDPSDVHSTDHSEDKPRETEVGEVRESPVDALEPPARWKDEHKSFFKTLDRSGQQFLLDREKDVEGHLTKRTQEISEIQKRYQKLDDVLKPFDEVAKRGGVDLHPHVGQALNYYFAFQRDPASTVKQLIQASKLTAEQLGLIEDPTVDPSIRALRERLESTERELANMKQGTVHAETQQLQSQVDSFREAKDGEGNQKHPHFDRVRGLMAPLVAQGKSLEEAYAEVVWAVPEYREAQTKVEREKAEKEAKKQAEIARLNKLKKAKQAETIAPSDAQTTTAGAGKFKSWDQALHESLNKLRS